MVIHSIFVEQAMLAVMKNTLIPRQKVKHFQLLSIILGKSKCTTRCRPPFYKKVQQWISKYRQFMQNLRRAKH